METKKAVSAHQSHLAKNSRRLEQSQLEEGLTVEREAAARTEPTAELRNLEQQ